MPTHFNTDPVAVNESLMILTTGIGQGLPMGDTQTFVLQQSSSHDEPNLLTMCQPLPGKTQSMASLFAGTGGVLKHSSGYIPLVCGGIGLEENWNEKCYHLGSSGASRDYGTAISVVGIMQQKRQGAASIPILNETALWVTGGTDDWVTTATTEWINVSMVLSGKVERLQEGPRLPEPLANHCLQMISGNMAIAYGGQSGASLWSTPYALSWIVEHLDARIEPAGNNNDLDDPWVPGPPMAMARTLSGCGMVRNTGKSVRFVVAAGGATVTSYFGLTAIPSVELLRVGDGGDTLLWEVGPQLPEPLFAASSANTGNQDALILAGGVLDGEFTMATFSIYCLRCAFDYCSWTEAWELDAVRYMSVALIIPPSQVQDDGPIGMYLFKFTLCIYVLNL